MLKGKKVLLGICGSIAAYKSVYLVRLLVKEGAEVKVVMTPYSARFITALTFSTLSKNPVLSDFTGDDESWNSHVELGLWADVFLIAPVTANTISKMANGACDNLLTAVYLSARCPVLLAPAMDLDMWQHPSVQSNIRQLSKYGNLIIPVEEGELASGLSGEGRMAEPEHIINYLKDFSSQEKKSPAVSGRLKGKRALVTAGPTIEAIDPVRYISNYSSGKMGVAIAKALKAEGADVVVVKGPATETISEKSLQVIEVTSAAQMYEACLKEYEEADITVMAAAVADYTPAKVAISKVKKQQDDLNISLKKTKDILQELGRWKKHGKILVGFALETDDELNNAREKLQKKNLDAIVLNSLKDKGAGFSHDTNKITIIDKYNNISNFELKPKAEVAIDIVEKIIGLLDAK